MQPDELKELAIRLAAVAERLDARSEAAVSRVEQTGASLEARAGRLAADSDRFAAHVAEALQRQIGDLIGRGINGPMEHFNVQIAAGARAASATADALDAERAALARERRSWIWLGSGAMLMGAVFTVGAAFYGLYSSRKEVERHQIEARLLRAYNAADVMLCGERLCAAISDDAPGYGDDKRYRQVNLRPK